MLKFRLALAVAALVVAVLLFPLPSQAAPGAWSSASGPAAVSLFAKVERWWSSLLSGGRAVPSERAQGTKIGCAIDPNGLPLPLCGVPDPSTILPTEPAPTSSSGSN
jgi:hypothetical protein